MYDAIVRVYLAVVTIFVYISIYEVVNKKWLVMLWSKLRFVLMLGSTPLHVLKHAERKFWILTTGFLRSSIRFI